MLLLCRAWPAELQYRAAGQLLPPLPWMYSEPNSDGMPLLIRDQLPPAWCVAHPIEVEPQDAPWLERAEHSPLGEISQELLIDPEMEPGRLHVAC